MAFVRIRPAAPLHESISAIWDWQVEPGAFRLERILPSPGTQMIVNLLEDETRVYADDAARRCERTEGCVFSGQATRSFLIDTAEQVAVMGVEFQPGAAVRFLREPMHNLADRHAALTALHLRGVAELRERLLAARDAPTRLRALEAWLRARFAPSALHPAVEHALRSLDAAPCASRVHALIEASGYSARRFGTLFLDQVGVAPKRYARLQRFRAAVTAVQHGRRVEWAQVAADCGFHDQPHLVREFRAFAGMTPGEYVSMRGPHVNHVPLT
ncbi:helix-turn-helix domain-containing protein [Dokdonella sp.]|uniref:helix-turn-helix domain-containing protein n=1 Tax=Dokdonella sp. TaxID=2291710 RepID=UPI001B2D36EB|nr:helix-turn-helix domain-containing protein [Dokdonella sp.]MBO9663979.1 AraC family transcriptional regulator [Dokdonella sp.]